MPGTLKYGDGELVTYTCQNPSNNTNFCIYIIKFCNRYFILKLKRWNIEWFKMWGAGKTTYLLSASFHDRNVYIWQAILT